MKKLIYAIFLFALVLVAPRIEAKSSAYLTNTNPAPNTEFVVCAEQVNPNVTTVLEGILENMGVEVQELKVLDLNIEESCTIHVRGTIDGKQIELTITVKGVSCAELLKQLM